MENQVHAPSQKSIDKEAKNTVRQCILVMVPNVSQPSLIKPNQGKRINTNLTT